MTNRLATFFAIFLLANSLSPSADAADELLIVVGAGGEERYEGTFKEWAGRWKNAAKLAERACTVLGGEPHPDKTDRELLQSKLEGLAGKSDDFLWLVLLGHGTFDRRSARFNLNGPDFTEQELAGWLKDVDRPTAVVCCFAASGPFLPALSAPNRIVLTSTKSGSELNFSRFGEFLSLAINDSAADLDKDQQTSLWEAYLAAGRRTEEWYKSQGLLATEHPLLDDNGDKLGTRNDVFRGLRPMQQADQGALDGVRAHQWHLVPGPGDAALTVEQRTARDELELAVLKLRDNKAAVPEEAYFAELEALLVKLARMYAADR